MATLSCKNIKQYSGNDQWKLTFTAGSTNFPFFSEVRTVF